MGSVLSTRGYTKRKPTCWGPNVETSGNTNEGEQFYAEEIDSIRSIGALSNCIMHQIRTEEPVMPPEPEKYELPEAPAAPTAPSAVEASEAPPEELRRAGYGGSDSSSKQKKVEIWAVKV